MNKKTLNFLNKLKNCSVSKKYSFDFLATQKIINIVIKFYSLGLIQSYKILKTKKDTSFKITVFLKVECPFKNLKVISTPSRKKVLNFKNIVKLQISLTTIIFFSTSRGILSHSDCLKHRIGGLGLFLVW